VPCGLAITEAPSGKLLRVSSYLEGLLGQPLYPATSVADYAHFQALHPNGKAYQPDEWPMTRALKGQAVNRKEIQRIMYCAEGGPYFEFAQMMGSI
jgi:hypothetical protein